MEKSMKGRPAIITWLIYYEYCFKSTHGSTQVSPSARHHLVNCTAFVLASKIKTEMARYCTSSLKLVSSTGWLSTRLKVIYCMFLDAFWMAPGLKADLYMKFNTSTYKVYHCLWEMCSEQCWTTVNYHHKGSPPTNWKQGCWKCLQYPLKT